ncbi:hypothetical protein ACFVYJ_03565 [Pontibacter sp. JAM-7]|uniref:hypothetical protein n=1 Tax=Pontibacter sp. JAM-7 TaxID=3366581 RepID=UPI003AF5AAD2
MWHLKRKQQRLKEKRELITAQKSAWLSCQYQWSAVNSSAVGVGNDLDDDIIISLTTFDKRIDDVYLTVESLLLQSLKPDRIILWLSEEEFSGRDIPYVLKLQQQRGLEVAFCPTDLGPYKKFFYAIQRYPDSLIITVDDDILYPHDLVDLLYRNYQTSPEVIPCIRAHGMKLDNRGELIPYKKWERPCSNVHPSVLTFPTGIGGVLYFPGCFDEQIFDQSLFMSLCPNADDIWLKAMSLKKGIQCQKVNDNRDFGSRFPVIQGSQSHCLKRINKSCRGGNDAKLKAVFDHFDLWGRLHLEKANRG